MSQEWRRVVNIAGSEKLGLPFSSAVGGGDFVFVCGQAALPGSDDGPSRSRRPANRDRSHRASREPVRLMPFLHVINPGFRSPAMEQTRRSIVDFSAISDLFE